MLFLCSNDEKCEVLCGSVFVFLLFICFCKKSSVGSVGVFLWIWSKKVFKQLKNMFFLFWRQIETEPFNYSRFMSRFNRKMTLKRLCSVQLGESCSRNLGNTSKNSYLMSPVQLNSASSTCPKSVQKEKEFTITAWHSFFKVSSLYTRPFSHIFKKFYRIQGGPYF